MDVVLLDRLGAIGSVSGTSDGGVQPRRGCGGGAAHLQVDGGQPVPAQARGTSPSLPPPAVRPWEMLPAHVDGHVLLDGEQDTRKMLSEYVAEGRWEEAASVVEALILLAYHPDPTTYNG